VANLLRARTSPQKRAWRAFKINLLIMVLVYVAVGTLAVTNTVPRWLWILAVVTLVVCLADMAWLIVAGRRGD